MAGLQSLLEDYRNWNRLQDWKWKKGNEEMFNGNYELAEDIDKWGGGFNPSNIGGIIGAIKIPKQSLAGLSGKLFSKPQGYIDVQHTFGGYQPPAKNSVIGFQVDPEMRGQGIGKGLIDMAIQEYPDIGAQVSSRASLKAFYDKGFRNPELSDASLEDYFKEFDDWGGSLFMMSPQGLKR